MHHQRLEIRRERRSDGENSKWTCVSAASPSASLSFEIKAASYRRFRQASAMLAHTEREERRI